jgi:hypothetical protein
MNIQAIKRECVSRRTAVIQDAVDEAVDQLVAAGATAIRETSSVSAEGAATFSKGEGFGEA